MDKLVIRGGRPLYGKVRVSGSKNSTLPILASTILTDEECIIKGVPALRDIDTLRKVLECLDVKTEFEDGVLRVLPGRGESCKAPWELVRQMRASVCVLGPLVAKRGRADVSLPGGCAIGDRPIDLHIKGLKALGAKITISEGYVKAIASRLKGARIFLGGPFGSTVLGTANIMMAGSLAEGETVIESSACEPEIADLARFINQMGGRVEGFGSPLIVINGVEHLDGAEYTIIPDRIEAATFMIASAMTGGEVTVEGCRPEHLGSVIDILRRIGVRVEVGKDSCTVKGGDSYKPVDVTTLPYPGVPTDVQAQLMALLCFIDGISVVTDKVFPDRFMHIAELRRMGANIRKEASSAIVIGARKLQGAEVMASDLRASAALVLAGLCAEGTTIVHRIYHLDRGYESFDEKLRALGADIQRVRE